MTVLNIHEIKARFSHYAKLVLKGRSFIIAYRNVPFAVLQPLTKNSEVKGLTFGGLKGKFELPDDFDSPLTDFENDYYGAQ